MSTNLGYTERLQANSDKVVGFMGNHGEQLDSMKGVCGTVARMLNTVFGNNISKPENDTASKWTLSAILTKVLDVVSPERENKKGGLLSFWKKADEPQKDAFDLPGLQSMSSPGSSSADILRELKITSNDIGTAQILNDLNITSNSMDDVMAGETLRALNISSNPMVQVMAKEFGQSTGTSLSHDDMNRIVQKTSMQSGMNSPLNL